MDKNKNEYSIIIFEDLEDGSSKIINTYFFY